MSKERTRLQLMWKNKDRRLLNHGASTYEWVEPQDWRVSEVRLLAEVEHLGDDGSDNLLIEGDSLYALTSLAAIPEYAEKYRRKVKLCYIDPPFNTGQTFTSYKDSLENSVWLTMFRDRLSQIRELLAPDGTVWVQLDDVQDYRARVLLDEVFGISNFVDSLTVETNPKGRQLDPFFAGSHNTLTVYARNIAKCDITSTLRELVNLSDYRESDREGNPARHLPLRNTNKRFNPTTRPNLYYPLFINPSDGSVSIDETDESIRVFPVFGDGTSAVWRWQSSTAQSQQEQMLGKQVNGQTGVRWDVFQIDTLTDDKRKRMKTIWNAREVGSTDTALSELEVLGIKGFSTPKPEKLLKRIIEASTSPGDIVLDCFAGSGTTAAVAHKLGRRWVTIELLGGNVDDYIKPRLNKVVEGSDEGGISIQTTDTLVGDLPEDVVASQVTSAISTYNKLADHGVFAEVEPLRGKKAQTPLGEVLQLLADNPDLAPDLLKELAKPARKVAKTTQTVEKVWTGGGGYTHLRVAESMFEDVGGNIVLADWATDGELAEAVAAQLRFPYEPQPPFAGKKGRQWLAVIDGMLTNSLVDYLLERSEPNETVVVVAQGLVPNVADYLSTERKGSKARKVPRDLARLSVHTERVNLEEVVVTAVEEVEEDA